MSPCNQECSLYLKRALTVPVKLYLFLPDIWDSRISSCKRRGFSAQASSLDSRLSREVALRRI